jgi:hypothetical protein
VSNKEAALAGLYGSKALAGNVGVAARVQEVLTPTWVLDAARVALGGTIALDPCASSHPANWFARYNMTLPALAQELDRQLHAATTKADKARLKKAVKPYYLGGALAERWDLGPAFVNEPFEFLEQWLAKCATEAALGTPIVMLGPTRGHRAWFWKYLRSAELVHLHSRFAFVGHTSSFPAPLFLASWGCKIPDLGARETHREQVT